MIPYWVLFLIPAFAAATGPTKSVSKSIVPWVFFSLFLILFIGLRYDTGGDWGNYYRQFLDYIEVPLSVSLQRGDWGYVFINWMVGKLGLDFYAVTLICAFIFVLGLASFARQQPNAWLAIAVAIPYIVIVIGMGYMRQGVALGFLLWGLSHLEQGRFKQFVVAVLLAALFHKTALVMIGLALFLHSKGKFIRFLAVLAVGYGLWTTMLADESSALWQHYVEDAMQSEGARIRVFMNLVPSLILIIYWKKWKENFPNPHFWRWMAFATIVSVPFVDLASTAIDRMALYLTPLQIAVYSRIPMLFSAGMVKPAILGVLFMYALVLFVWLNFATHAPWWLPYRNWLFS